MDRQPPEAEVLGQIASGLAHDLNNQLAVIEGNLEMLAQDPGLGDRARTLLQRARVSADKVAALNRRLLAFGANVTHLAVRADLDAIAATVVRAFDVPGSLPIVTLRKGPAACRAMVVPDQLRLALSVLVDLAAAGGATRVEIRTGTIELGAAEVAETPWVRPGRYARIAVADDGPAMPRSLRNRFFDPSLPGSARDAARDAVSRLSLVCAVAKNHRGYIHAGSDPTARNLFTVDLPVGAPSEGSEDAEVPAERPRRVLLVEDEPTVLRLATSVLREGGFEVVAAANAEEARSRFEASRDFDVLVTDLTLPGIDGETLAHALRELRPDLAVVYTTGMGKDGLDPAAVERMGGRFLDKPYRLRDLLEIVREVAAV